MFCCPFGRNRLPASAIPPRSRTSAPEVAHFQAVFALEGSRRSVHPAGGSTQLLNACVNSEMRAALRTAEDDVTESVRSSRLHDAGLESGARADGRLRAEIMGAARPASPWFGSDQAATAVERL